MKNWLFKMRHNCPRVGDKRGTNGWEGEPEAKGANYSLELISTPEVGATVASGTRRAPT